MASSSEIGITSRLHAVFDMGSVYLRRARTEPVRPCLFYLRQVEGMLRVVVWFAFENRGYDDGMDTQEARPGRRGE